MDFFVNFGWLFMTSLLNCVCMIKASMKPIDKKTYNLPSNFKNKFSFRAIVWKFKWDFAALLTFDDQSAHWKSYWTVIVQPHKLHGTILCVCVVFESCSYIIDMVQTSHSSNFNTENGDLFYIFPAKLNFDVFYNFFSLLWPSKSSYIHHHNTHVELQDQ